MSFFEAIGIATVIFLSSLGAVLFFYALLIGGRELWHRLTDRPYNRVVDRTADYDIRMGAK